MHNRIYTAVILFLLMAASGIVKAQTGLVKIEPINYQRVNEIAAMLPENPRGFGDPIEKRRVWDSLFKTGKFTRLIKQADSISILPFPRLTDDIYMSYYGGRDSETSKRFILKRRMLLSRMIWAECLTNTGKYMPSIVAALTDIVNTVSWTFPAEDRQKTNYQGKIFTIGLSSSAYGSEMAQALYLLRSKLPGQLQNQILENLQQKVFAPTLNAIQNNNANGEFISLTDIGNHNPVTLANVAGAALAVLNDKKQRAVFAAIAERYSNNFLLSYLEDGYCTEGIGYYTYGFSHYIFLREALWQATQGKIDIIKRPKVEKILRFAPDMEIINGVFPAISDCEQYIEPGPQLMYYLNKGWGLGLQQYNELNDSIDQPALCYLMFYFPNITSMNPVSAPKNAGLPLRSYFANAGVLTVRPAIGSAINIGATFKGGNNAEQHNHNDLGSYTIAAGDELITGDVGLATYTPKYFTKDRYRLFKTAASYGHNVPLINNVQQREGIDARAEIISTDFTPAKDVFIMDITSAYPDSAALNKLVRSFIYERGEGGNSKAAIVIEDNFSLKGEGIFESALITRHNWKKLSPNELLITGKKEKLKVTITASNNNFIITDEVIDEGPMPYTRIAIKLPASSVGYIRLKFERQ